MVKSSEKKWLEIIQKWENSETQKQLVSIMDGIGRKSNFEPYFGQVVGIILAFASTIYRNAYSYDNLTGVVFAELSHTMPHSASSGANNLKEQRDLIKKILKIMPNGFKNYSISGGYLWINDNKSLTVRKAEEFIDFIRSDKFDDILIEEIHRQYRNFKVTKI